MCNRYPPFHIAQRIIRHAMLHQAAKSTTQVQPPSTRLPPSGRTRYTARTTVLPTAVTVSHTESSSAAVSLAPTVLATATVVDEHCPGCGHVRNSEFCGHCGQRRCSRLDTRAVLGNTLHTLLSLEGPWLRTIKDLLLRPSALILAYFAGARHRYVNPVLLIIVLYSFFFLLCHWLGVDPFAGTMDDGKVSNSVLTFITNYSGQLSVLIAYPTALLMRRVWPDTTTAERYVALLYAQSLGAIGSILMVFIAAGYGRYDVNLSSLLSLLTTLYAYAGVHPSRRRSLLIGLVASLGYLLVVMVTAFVVGVAATAVFGLGK